MLKRSIDINGINGGDAFNYTVLMRGGGGGGGRMLHDFKTQLVRE